MRGAKLAVATAVALLAASALLMSLFARQGVAEVSLLPPDQIGAQASADVTFADLAPPQSGSANAFHVDPDGADNVAGNADDGSDTNPGTRDRPWKTITKAAQTLTRGQVAYIHGGTYNERITTTNPGEASAPIWLVEAQGESAIINGTGTSSEPFIRITQPYWIVDGFEINAASLRAQAVRFDSAKHAVVKNIDAHNGVGNAAIVFDKTEDAALLSSKVHDYSWTEADGSPKDSHGVLVYRSSKRILVKGNDSWGHTGDDLQCVDEDGVASADDPTDITIEKNRYGNTHPDGALRTKTRENAIDIKTCRNVTVRANKMFGFRPASTAPGGTALVAHMSADRVLVEQNRFWDNGIAASLGSSQNCCLGAVVFRRNLIFESTTLSGGKGYGVRVGPAKRFEAYHNTFHKIPNYAIRLGDDGRVDQAVLINNIVTEAGSAIQIYAPNVPNLTSDRNLFWNAPLPVGWQYDQTSIFKDPLFVDNPKDNDYFTKVGSPARNVALPEPRFVDAANSTYCHDGPDIGFLESCTSEPQSGTLTYAPTNDSRVEEANASTNYGGSPMLRTDGGTGSRVDAYLQYAVTNIPAGEQVQSATLRLWDTDNGTADGPAVYTSATGWSESSITWANKPAKSASGVADKGAVASGSWVEFDVTPLVTGNATYSFVLSQPGTDGANYASKEDSDPTKKPQLVVTTGNFVYTRESDPARTVVTNSAGEWLATFTDGSYTVSLKGPTRTFSEGTATYPVTHSTWVRVLPKPFDGQMDETWLKRELTNTSPDVLQLAMQYIEGAPPIYDASGLRIAGDADYGPLVDGARQEGSDFNDYLGVPWTYGTSVDSPEESQIGSLDCSGFMRMVFGYRSELPLALTSSGTAIPRRAYQMLDSAPGVVTVPNTGTQVTSFTKLSPGDLVFFDVSTDDGTQIDHVGMYLGLDAGGNHRFISSRKSINGPTLGDYAGKSILNGTGLYASSFRAVRRL